MEIVHLEKDNFKELIKKEDKVLIDFFANWCGPCKMLGPILEQANGEIKVIKVDVDVFEELAREYGVMSIPTIVLLEKEKEIKRNIGFIDKSSLEKFVK